MNVKPTIIKNVLLLFVFGASFLVVNAASGRKVVHGVSLPKGVIQIDGMDDDWKAIPKIGDVKVVSKQQHVHLRKNSPNGSAPYGGNSDLSIELFAAVDSDYLYLLCNVIDEYHCNQGAMLGKAWYTGDDMEIFIDASPSENRFAKKSSNNFIQIGIVPRYSFLDQKKNRVLYFKNRKRMKTFDLEHATRLRPWGWTYELAIPKANFPHWKARKEMDSIGFGLEVHDSDISATMHHKGILKAVRWLLKPVPHHIGPQNLSELKFDRVVKDIKKPNHKKAACPTVAEIAQLEDKPNEGRIKAVAQDILDNLADPTITEVVNKAAVSSIPLIQQTGALILARDSSLKMSAATQSHLIERLLSVKKEPSRLQSERIALSYSMLALAHRKKLPVSELFGFFVRGVANESNDSSVRLNFLHAVSVSGDASICPQLVHLLYDGDFRVRMLAAQMLSQFNHQVALPQLKDLHANDSVEKNRWFLGKIVKSFGKN